MFSLSPILNPSLELESSLLLAFPCLSLNFRYKTTILMLLVETGLRKWKPSWLSSERVKAYRKLLFYVEYWCCMCESLLMQHVKASMVRYCLATEPNTKEFKTVTILFSQITLAPLGQVKLNFVESNHWVNFQAEFSGICFKTFICAFYNHFYAQC